MDSISGRKVLVTGGAGFIGSNLVEKLLELGAIVTVLDNLSTGKYENIVEFESNANFKFIKGDICDVEICKEAVKGQDLVTHQAALGSVPRSIEFPHKTHEVNATGFLNMLHASKEEGIKRFVYASSSSVYGDSTKSPKVEGEEGNLLSPYAVTKQLNEKYAGVYAKLHNIQTVGLRYFNIFGPKQDPNGVYAAAIPKFISRLRNNEEVIINGDGLQSRDFTYVKNAVSANVLALFSNSLNTNENVFNVACNDSFTLNDVVSTLKDGLKTIGIYSESIISHGPDRPGDIKHSLANITNIQEKLGYSTLYTFKEGVEEYIRTLK